MGYTTGPYVASADGSPSSHGHYLSVWERGRNDAFRVILDVGTPGPAPDRAATPLSPDNGASEALNEVRELAVGSSAADSPPAGAEESLLVADRAFGEDQEAEGTLAALGRHATAGVRVHRSGRAPFVGPWPGAEGGADVQALVGERFATPRPRLAVVSHGPARSGSCTAIGSVPAGRPATSSACGAEIPARPGG